MDPSLQDWYSSQLAHPEAFWLASAEHQRELAIESPDPALPSSSPIDFDAFLRGGFEESDQPLGVVSDLPQQLSAAGSCGADAFELVSASSAPASASAQLSTTTSLPSSLHPHAVAGHEGVEAARTSSGSYSTSLKKLMQGRESQKRFRERQKARSQAQQAELERAQAELAEAKARQKDLESRNLVLESLSNLGREGAASASQSGAMRERRGMFTVTEVHIHRSQTPLPVSVQGRKDTITLQQIRQCSLPAFSKLWTDYMRELATCLLHTKAESGSSSKAETASARMQQLTAEASALMARMLLDPRMHKALMHGRMDEGSPTPNRLDEGFYHNLVDLYYPRRGVLGRIILSGSLHAATMLHNMQAAMALSDAQMSDMMLLRTLYHSKRGALGRERDRLIQSMAQHEQGSPHPTEGLQNLSHMAAELQMNASEEHQVHYRVALAVYTGILNTKQRAELMVLCYPYMPILRVLLDTCASRGEPTFEQLTAITEPDFMGNEWQHFTGYIQDVTSKTFHQISHDYLPIQQ